ncbi:MAG TPA: hypothetical protein VF720_05010, partial [Candidatus Eisenbacteria bacterium]
MILKRNEGPNSRPRNRPRPDRTSPPWLRRLAKVGLALSVVLVSVPLFPLQRRAETTHYQVGQVIDEEILAPFGFDILRGEEEIDRDRTDAVRSVAPIFTVDETRAEATLRRLTRFAIDVRRAANSTQLRKGERAEQIGRLGVPLTAESRRVLADPDTSAVILEEVNRLITQSYKVGIADQSEMASLNDRLKVKLRHGGDET